MMEAEVLLKNSYEPPAIKDNYSNTYGVEHRLGAEPVAFLDPPVNVDADGLGGDSHNEKVRQRKGVVRYDSVLQGADDSHGSVE